MTIAEDDSIASRLHKLGELSASDHVILRQLWASKIGGTLHSGLTLLRKAGAVMASRTYANREPDDVRGAKPSLLERAGLHVMRETAVRWCRMHPVEAAALPSWDLSVLRKTLEGVA